MEEALGNLIASALTSKEAIKFFSVLITSLVLVAAGMWLKQLSVRYFAFKVITSSFDISKNDTFRFPTPVGFENFVLEEVDLSRIHFRGNGIKMSIPITAFMEMSWVKVLAKE
jgi:hypothetical protein